MAVRTQQLANRSFNAAGGSGDELLYTAPAGHRALVKYFNITPYFTDVDAVSQLYVQGPDYANLLFKVGAVYGVAFELVECYGVLEPGDQLRFYYEQAPNPAFLSAHVGGVVFEL